MLHRFAKLLAGCTVLLVVAGSLVTSTGSGLSVPDWPTSYGWSMFTFPPSKWVGGILCGHRHRLTWGTDVVRSGERVRPMCIAHPRRRTKRGCAGGLGPIVAKAVL